jgi:hypothetical protein
LGGLEDSRQVGSGVSPLRTVSQDSGAPVVCRGQAKSATPRRPPWPMCQPGSQVGGGVGGPARPGVLSIVAARDAGPGSQHQLRFARRARFRCRPRARAVRPEAPRTPSQARLAWQKPCAPRTEGRVGAQDSRVRNQSPNPVARSLRWSRSRGTV